MIYLFSEGLNTINILSGRKYKMWHVIKMERFQIFNAVRVYSNILSHIDIKGTAYISIIIQ